MNKRGEFKLTSMLIGILIAFGLFFTMIASTFTSLSGVYDTSAYDEADLKSFYGNYSHLDSLSDRLTKQANNVDTDVSVDANAFDYLANVFKDVLAPFKFIYKSYDNLITASSQAVIDLNLFPDFAVWAQAVIITMVIIGVVMFTIYLKVRK